MHRPDQEHRSYSLIPVRKSVDQLDAIIAQARELWPLDLLPEWLDQLIQYRTETIALVRDGRLARCAEVCNASD